MSTKISCTRYHDFSSGHRVVGHEGHCRFLHGHNYRVHFTCEAQTGVEQLDSVGRVIDFGIIKSQLCMWLEENWDHKFLHWEKDELIADMVANAKKYRLDIAHSLVSLPFNPTAENMAQYLIRTVGPQQLEGSGVELTKVTIDETRKCSATVEI